MVEGDFDDDVRGIGERVRSFTLTELEKVDALCSAVDYIVDNQIPGSVVECGVWRGGSMMAVALRLLARGVNDRELFLYDTFTGMTESSSRDRSDAPKISALDWLAVDVSEVRANVSSTNYPPERVHCIVGAVENTLPEQAPAGGIALLRLDTDWYESTRHELEHLYPRIVPGGILIVDDYGWNEGAKAATDEFLSGLDRKPLLVRVGVGRIAVVPGSVEPARIR